MLTSASATYESVYGRIASAWMKENDHMRLDVTIPANTRAVVTLPGATLSQVIVSGILLPEADGVANPIPVGKDIQLKIGSAKYLFEYPILGLANSLQHT